ncbi:MAG: hypothetical protein ACYSTI_05870 [Planctomycetota bacterium]|jgi:hypothetical protein
MVDNSIPWPKKGDKLFTSGGDWCHEACLNYMGPSAVLYAGGYKDAADILVERISKETLPRDALVYPIVFLYRQYIELMLKEVIKDGNKLFDVTEEYPTHHNIAELWKQCRGIIEKVWPKGPKVDLDSVEECLYEFSKTDPTSTAFRYPTDKDGEPSVPGISRIDLRNLSGVMSGIEVFFTGAIDGISSYLDAKGDMESEYS